MDEISDGGSIPPSSITMRGTIYGSSYRYMKESNAEGGASQKRRKRRRQWRVRAEGRPERRLSRRWDSPQLHNDTWDHLWFLLSAFLTKKYLFFFLSQILKNFFMTLCRFFLFLVIICFFFYDPADYFLVWPQFFLTKLDDYLLMVKMAKKIIGPKLILFA